MLLAKNGNNNENNDNSNNIIVILALKDTELICESGSGRL